MEAITTEKAMHGIGAYLQRSGLEILEEGWAHGSDRIDFVADDEGDLVFIACKVSDNDGHGFDEDGFSREAFERIAAAYLTENSDISDSQVRFDIVSMLVLADHKGLLRHHRNALSVGD